jgi:hypothetical protein
MRAHVTRSSYEDARPNARFTDARAARARGTTDVFRAIERSRTPMMMRDARGAHAAKTYDLTDYAGSPSERASPPSAPPPTLSPPSMSTPSSDELVHVLVCAGACVVARQEHGTMVHARRRLVFVRRAASVDARTLADALRAIGADAARFATMLAEARRAPATHGA